MLAFLLAWYDLRRLHVPRVSCGRCETLMQLWVTHMQIVDIAYLAMLLSFFFFKNQFPFLVFFHFPPKLKVLDSALFPHISRHGTPERICQNNQIWRWYRLKRQKDSEDWWSTRLCWKKSHFFRGYIETQTHSQPSKHFSYNEAFSKDPVQTL